MRKLSITRRLIVFVVLTQLVLTAAVVGLSSYLTRWQLRTSFDAALHGRAMAVAALVRFSEDDPPTLIFDSRLLPSPLDSHHPDVYEVTDRDGRLIARSASWPGELPPPRKSGQSYWNIHVDGRQFRVVRLKDIPVLDEEGPGIVNSSTITVIYAASTDEITERAWAVALFTCIGSLLLLGLASLAAVWMVRRGLSPLSELAASADRVTAADWKLHAPQEAHATLELAPLTAAMDRMLATLQQAFTSQREFIANAAHELKTPIAVLKSTLQLALQRPREADEYRKRLHEALDDVSRLESLAHSLLRLARAEQLQSARRDDLPVVDLAATCEQSADRWRPAAEAKAVRIQVSASAAPQLHGDPDDLELIWNNLLDNAIRYSPAASQVVVSISKENGHARVDVRDHGPGIDPQELQVIFDRFHRADASRSRETGGYGLGLAIAKAMVEAYGGSIAAESVAGDGTTVSVRLPV